MKNYRKEVFTLLPNIRFLDGLNQNDEDANDSDAGMTSYVYCNNALINKYAALHFTEIL